MKAPIMNTTITLPLTEINVLPELERLLQENGSLNEGETIPLIELETTVENI